MDSLPRLTIASGDDIFRMVMTTSKEVDEDLTLLEKVFTHIVYR